MAGRGSGVYLHCEHATQTTITYRTRPAPHAPTRERGRASDLGEEWVEMGCVETDVTRQGHTSTPVVLRGAAGDRATETATQRQHTCCANPEQPCSAYCSTKTRLMRSARLIPSPKSLPTLVVEGASGLRPLAQACAGRRVSGILAAQRPASAPAAISCSRTSRTRRMSACSPPRREKHRASWMSRTSRSRGCKREPCDSFISPQPFCAGARRGALRIVVLWPRVDSGACEMRRLLDVWHSGAHPRQTGG